MPPLPSEAPTGASVKATEELDPPEHQQPVPLPEQVVKKITVIALRPGFYMNHRRIEGDRFDVANFEDLGSWMKCVEPLMEKKHRAAIIEKATTKKKVAKEDAGD